MTDAEAPRTFEEPWQAQAFALAVALRDAGVIAWPDFSAALGEQIARAGEDDGSHYYEHWLAALEQVVVKGGRATPAELDQLKLAWSQAYEHTPHGRPVELPTL